MDHNSQSARTKYAHIEDDVESLAHAKQISKLELDAALHSNDLKISIRGPSQPNAQLGSRGSAVMGGSSDSDIRVPNSATMATSA